MTKEQHEVHLAELANLSLLARETKLEIQHLDEAQRVMNVEHYEAIRVQLKKNLKSLQARARTILQAEGFSVRFED